MEVDDLNKLAWYVSLAISLFGFLLIRYYFTLKPTEKIGEINPAFIPGIFLIPFVCLSLFITFIVGSEYFAEKQARTYTKYALFMLLIIVAGGLLEYVQVSNDLETFGGGVSAPHSKLYELPIWNSYTNGWFLNESVFFFIHGIAFGLGMLKKVPIEKNKNA